MGRNETRRDSRDFIFLSFVAQHASAQVTYHKWSVAANSPVIRNLPWASIRFQMPRWAGKNAGRSPVIRFSSFPMIPRYSHFFSKACQRRCLHGDNGHSNLESNLRITPDQPATRLPHPKRVPRGESCVFTRSAGWHFRRAEPSPCMPGQETQTITVVRCPITPWRPDCSAFVMRPRTTCLFIVLVYGLTGFAWTGRGSQSTRKTLDYPSEIQGYDCAKGYAWLYDNGRLERCTVARDTTFGEAQIPSGSIIVLDPDGNPRFAFLSRNWPILGPMCRGGAWFGPGEGPDTAFYPNGKLKVCWLAGDQYVQGVPCKDSGGFFAAILGHGNRDVEFYENGRLKSCTLAKDFADLKRGQFIVQTQ